MMNSITGPILTDEYFFNQCLDFNYKGMDTVRDFTKSGDYAGARKAFSTLVRASLDPNRYFNVPFEAAENIYQLPGETDQQVCERLLNHVFVSVGISHDFGKDCTIDWMANPTANQYKEWTWQLNRHNELKTLAKEYRKTEDPRYAELAADLFSSWVKQALCPEDLPGQASTCWRTIECGLRMGANWPYALHTFYDSEYFTDDILVDWYKSIWEHGNRLTGHHTHGNWLIMEMNGLAHIAILCPMFRESQFWREFSFQTLVQELNRQIYPDGFQYELTTGYHNVTINNYQRLILLSRTYDIPVPSDIFPKLELACDVDIRLMMPDGCLPDINDGKKHFCQKLFLKRRAILSDSPTFRWITSGRTEGTAPDYLSVALPWSGFFVMRTGWTPQDTWGLFDGAPFGHGHQHEDKLSLLIHAGGKLILTEGGNYAYDDSEMRQYVRSTRSHNTVRVDGMDQNRRTDYHWEDEDITKKADLKWNISTSLDYAESSYDEGYGMTVDKSIRHHRRVFFIKDTENGMSPFFIVSDRIYADTVHTYEYLWHVDSPYISKSESGVNMEELFVGVSSAQSISVIRGQESPEWQGFISTSQVQGSYRPINCITVKSDAADIRMVTILYPHQEEHPILNIQAGSNPADETIDIYLKDGQCLSYRESELMQAK